MYLCRDLANVFFTFDFDQTITRPNLLQRMGLLLLPLLNPMHMKTVIADTPREQEIQDLQTLSIVTGKQP